MSAPVGFMPGHLVGKTRAACKVAIAKAIGWNLDPYAVAMAPMNARRQVLASRARCMRAIARPAA